MCTPLLSIFISASVHVSGNYVPIIRRTHCIYETLVFFTAVCVAVWSAVELNILRSSVHLDDFI